MSGAEMADDALVINYHAVSPEWPAALSVHPADFERQVQGLLGRGYRAMTVEEIARGGGAARSFAITFDDGFRSVAKHAAPILARLGIPATVFVVTDFVGSGEPMSWPGIADWHGTAYEPELRALDWSELLSLAGAGWEIGSHTCSHPRLSELSDAALAEELRASREHLEERLGAPCQSLAYPYGDHDDRVVRAAAAAGYERAFTVPARLRSGDPLRWPRIGIYHQESALSFAAKVSPTVRKLRTTAAARWALSLRRSARDT
jgi:peptidoglycan/xylan/chitin deacetylase (PgdA/CDA1 family)